MRHDAAKCLDERTQISGSASCRRITSIAPPRAASRRSTTARPARSSACTRATASRSTRRGMSYPDGAPLQAFTAIGRVRAGTVYQVEVDPGFRPFRLDVEYLRRGARAGQATVAGALVHPRKTHWGAAFRFGVVRVPAADFARIAAAMGRSFAADFPAVARARRDGAAALCSARWIRRRHLPSPAHASRFAGSGHGSRRSRRPDFTPCSPRASRCSPSNSIARFRMPTASTSPRGTCSAGATADTSSLSRVPAGARSRHEVRRAVDRARADRPARIAAWDSDER